MKINFNIPGSILLFILFFNDSILLYQLDAPLSKWVWYFISDIMECVGITLFFMYAVMNYKPKH